MESWVTILSFNFDHEAHLVKTKLESEGIRVNLLDEYINQLQPFYAGANGGVKLQVLNSDIIRAKFLLNQLGYLKSDKISELKWLVSVNEVTSKWPIIGKLPFELRAIVILAIVLLAICLPLFFYFA